MSDLIQDRKQIYNGRDMAVLAVVFTIYDYGIATSRVKDSPVRGEQGRRDDRSAVVAASNSVETRQAPSDTPRADPRVVVVARASSQSGHGVDRIPHARPDLLNRFDYACQCRSGVGAV